MEEQKRKKNWIYRFEATQSERRKNCAVKCDINLEAFNVAQFTSSLSVRPFFPEKCEKSKECGENYNFRFLELMAGGDVKQLKHIEVEAKLSRSLKNSKNFLAAAAAA